LSKKISTPRVIKIVFGREKRHKNMENPGFQEYFLPVLAFLGDGKGHFRKEIFERMAQKFGLNEEQKLAKVPSGSEPTYQNRIGWVLTYLKNARLISSPSRSFFKISRRGLGVLASNPKELNTNFLKRYDSFNKFQTSHGSKAIGETIGKESATPTEIVEEAYKEISDSVCSELLSRIRDNSSEFFENLVVDLVVSMGYGGNITDAGKAVGKTGDGGVDGVVKQDRLGLGKIYIQAKNWKPESTIGRPEVQGFVGALQEKKAKRGIFITTASFSKGAKEYIEKIQDPIILIDGEELVRLMFEYNIGVTTVKMYQVKRIDGDYFDEN
jgi:restriction system protein